MIRGIFTTTVFAVALGASAHQPPTRQPHALDAAAWNRLLASAPTDQRTVRVGDMILLRSYIQAVRDFLNTQGTQPDSAFDGSVVLWPGGVVPYVFDPGVSALHQKAFLDAAADWATFANVSFVSRTNQTDYVYVQEGANGDNSAGVGKLGGQQNLTVSAWTRNVICHEIGHTLGLVHEHQRSDRDTYVAILTQNIQSGDEFAFGILPNSNNRGVYDFLSIMHYNRHAFANPSTADTIEPKAGYGQYIDVMGNTYGNELSQLDRQGMALVYGAGPVISNVVTNTKDSGPGSLRAAIFYGIDHANTTITFNIPTGDPGHANNVYTIQPTDVMTTPGPGTVINGATQPNGNPNGPSIVIDGTNWPAPTYAAPAFYLNGANCTIRSLVIINSSTAGIQISGSGATGNRIAGCYIGVAGNGTAAAPNVYSNISLTNGANGNIIGGTGAADRNLISGNSNDGIYIADPTTTNNVVSGNFIGTDRTGAVALANGYAGIGMANGTHGNTIGGMTAGAGNVISGNAQGIAIFDSTTNQNVIAGNYIGLTQGGNAALPNSGRGVTIFSGASNNTVGGNAPGARNVISGNNGDGVALIDAATNGNVVSGNFIGLDWTGTNAIANSGSGVYVFGGAHNNVIGGTTAESRNLISGNGGDGLTISDIGSNANTIQGNTIGLNISGNAVPNSFRGVTLQNGTQNNLIGGSTAGAPNIISGNTYEGIVAYNNGTTGNTFQHNDIFSNGDLGIRLDSGSGSPNNLQAAPAVTSAVLSINNATLNGATTIGGSLNSTASTNFRIEFFANAAADPSGFGEGQFFIGETNVTTNGSGSASFSFQAQTAVPVGYFVAATATDSATGNSSEFSQDVTVTTMDSNGDGIPDSWAMAHGFSVNAAIANQDTDGTGMTNLQKFYAGLDPLNPNSFLRITSITRSGNDIQFAFPSVTGRIYRAEWRNDLLTGSWQPLLDGIVGTGASIQLVDPQAAATARRFYRVRVLPP
jgi:hypothetical protein